MSKRKVRKDFDKRQPITVEVYNSSVEEKKKVQQAFFDIGISWPVGIEEYILLNKDVYTNVLDNGNIGAYLIWTTKFKILNNTKKITPKEFFDMVYEPQGHQHAELMMQYAEDAKKCEAPWKLWQIRGYEEYPEEWFGIHGHPQWDINMEYRRKPKTHIVNGVEVPDLRFEPKINDRYYTVDIYKRDYFSEYISNGDNLDSLWAERGLCYEYTEAGKQAAILHAKVLLGIVDE